jgi:hypothetical protein
VCPTELEPATSATLACNLLKLKSTGRSESAQRDKETRFVSKKRATRKKRLSATSKREPIEALATRHRVSTLSGSRFSLQVRERLFEREVRRSPPLSVYLRRGEFQPQS